MTRQSRERRTPQPRRRQRNRALRWLYLGGISIVGLLIIIGVALPAGLGPTGSRDRVRADGPGQHVAQLSALHIPDGSSSSEYNTNPPTSGPHWNTPARCGIFTEPVPTAQQPHNLEHGWVIVQYNTQDEALIAQLTALVKSLRDFPNYLILAPYPDMDATIALTAWGVIDTMDTLDEGRIKDFLSYYRGLQDIEPGAPGC